MAQNKSSPQPSRDPADQEDGKIEGMTNQSDSIASQQRSEQESSNQPTNENAPTTSNGLRYNMNHPKRGKAIIFNQKHFTTVDNLPTRDGTDVDRDDLSSKLTDLHFQVECHNDLTLDGIERVLETISKEDHSDRDTLLIAVFSHGDPGILYAKDKCYKIGTLWSYFTDDRCPTLAGKPRLFFIQACQGKSLDSGTMLSHSTITGTGSESYFYSTFQPISFEITPTHLDFLLCYSTIPGFYAWRNSSDGSWFVQALCRVLGKHSRTTHLLDMMTMVSQTVAFDYESNVPDRATMDQKKQIPCITSFLTRQVFFEPK